MSPDGQQTNANQLQSPPGPPVPSKKGVSNFAIVAIAVSLIIACILIACVLNSIYANASPTSKISITDKDAQTYMLGVSGTVSISFTVQNSGNLGSNVTIKCTVSDPSGQVYSATKSLYIGPGESKSYSVWVYTKAFDTDRYWSYDCIVQDIDD